jgi:hypothetical protein
MNTPIGWHFAGGFTSQGTPRVALFLCHAIDSLGRCLEASPCLI